MVFFRGLLMRRLVLSSPLPGRGSCRRGALARPALPQLHRALSSGATGTEYSNSGGSFPAAALRDLGKEVNAKLSGSFIPSSTSVCSEEIARGERFHVLDPATQVPLGSVANASEGKIKETIAAAVEAQHTWAGTTARERSAILNRWAASLIDNADYLGRLITMEQGKPLAEGVGEIKYAASFVSYYANECIRMSGEVSPVLSPNERIMVIKQPVGLAACITPWNFPTAMITRKAGAALAAGCGMIVKPSAETPLSAEAACILAHEAGVPADLLPCITCDHELSITAGQLLATEPSIAKISFTGSTRVGKVLMELAASTVKRTSMELGGNAPFIVFEDADVEAAVDGAMASKFRNAGQTCVCANRFFVHEHVYDQFMALFKEKIMGLKVGHGLQEHTTLGPLITTSAAARVHGMVQEAVGKGAKVLCGGDYHELGGTFYQPTLMSNVPLSSELFCDEIFGPVAAVHSFSNDAEVVAKANNTRAGLVSYFYSRDIGRIWRTAEQLQYGMVGVNTGIISTEVAPFGGVKESGIGREGSAHGMDEYQEMKYIMLNIQ